MSGLFTERGWNSGRQGSSGTLEQIELVGAVADGAELPAKLPEAPMPWPQLLGRLGALAFRAASPATSARDREALLAFLEVLAATPFVARPDRVRLAEVVDRSPQGAAGYATRVVRKEARKLFFKRGNRTWLFSFVEVDPATTGNPVRLMLELSPDGSFGLPPGYALRTTAYHTIDATWDGNTIRTFLELVRERGPVVWRPELVERLADATGLTQPEAGLVLAGLPGIGIYGVYEHALARKCGTSSI